jgi:pimeloyl-ACP methyl ester carboxylesterase
MKILHLSTRFIAYFIVLSIVLSFPASRFCAASDAKEPVQKIKPTIVLVHGAFAESSSWNGVVKLLLAEGYPVVAVANPLRGLHSDSEFTATVLQSIHGPIIAVGHSYGGSVITNASVGNSNVKALVFVAGVAPDEGESVSSLVGRFPGSTLGPTLAPGVPLLGGGKDLYIQQDKFPVQFAADLRKAEAKLMAAEQRPVTELALNEASGPAAWKTIPSWFIFGSLDKNIPEAAHKFMAQRANAKSTVEIKGASHVVMISHPDAVVALIDQAASAVAE